MDDESNFEEDLTKKVKTFFDVMRKRKTDITGLMALKYVRNLSQGDSPRVILVALGSFVSIRAMETPRRKQK